MSLLFGALFFFAGLALLREWDLLGLGIYAVLAGAVIRALTGYASYWGHLESFAKYFPGSPPPAPAQQLRCPPQPAPRAPLSSRPPRRRLG